MTIHPEYPNKLFAECFQWKIDNEDKPLPAPLQQAFHKEEHRINEWLKEHYQELKTAWASDIERLFEWIRNEWPQRADIRLTKPISFALDIAIASECDRKNGSYTWFADEIEISDWYRPLMPNAEAEFLKRTREKFETELKNFVTDVRRYMELRPEISYRREGAQPLDYEWLARYQCNGESFSDIARKHISDEDKHESLRVTVNTTCSELAHFLGLELRQEKGGRPKGKKSRYTGRRSKNL